MTPVTWGVFGGFLHEEFPSLSPRPTSAAEGRRLGSWDVGGDIHPLVIPTFNTHRIHRIPMGLVRIFTDPWMVDSFFYGKLVGKYIDAMHWCYGLVIPPSTNSSGGKAIEQYMLIYQVRGFLSLSLSLCIYIYIYTPWTNKAPARKPSQKETIVFQPSISRCYSHACFKGVYINSKSIQALLFISNQHLWTLWHQKKHTNFNVQKKIQTPPSVFFLSPLFTTHIPGG